MRKRQIALEHLILFFMPPEAAFLRQSRSVAGHAFNKVVGDIQAGSGPVLLMPIMKPAKQQGQSHPEAQQPHLQNSIRTLGERGRRHDELDHGQE
jgi:hypothetical protein